MGGEDVDESGNRVLLYTASAVDDEPPTSAKDIADSAALEQDLKNIAAQIDTPVAEPARLPPPQKKPDVEKKPAPVAKPTPVAGGEAMTTESVKKLSYMKLKKACVAAGASRAEVDACLGRYELENLLMAHV